MNNTHGEYLLAFDVQADGTLRNRRNFAKYEGVDENASRRVASGADGLAVDSEGRIYVATTDRRSGVQPRGQHLGTIPLSRAPQNLAFAGADKKTLYVVGRGVAFKVRMVAEGFKGRAEIDWEESNQIMSASRPYRAGESLEDFCRACKTDRMHTVIVVDGDGRPIRVACGYCHSEHNYRGGPRVERSGAPPDARPAPHRCPRPRHAGAAPFPIVSDRERIAPPMTVSDGTADDLELLLRRIIREETGITPVVPAEKWRGGTLVLRPGTAGLQEKSWPIETFFHKIVMLRNRLRTLEQQVNAARPA